MKIGTRSVWDWMLGGSLILFGVALGAYVLILAGIVELPVFGRSLSPAPPTPVVSSGVEAGSPASEFTLQSLDGDTVSLSSFQGRPVLINFWATWCPPCRKEMPALQRVYEQYQDAGFVVLAVNVQEPAETVQPFVDELGLSFPILLDADGSVMKDYRVMGLPSSYFVTPDGRIHSSRTGEMSEAFMIEAVQELLEQ